MTPVTYLSQEEHVAVSETVHACLHAIDMEPHIDYGVALERDRNGKVQVLILPVPKQKDEPN